MPLILSLPEEFPDEAVPVDHDIKSLYQKRKWKELDGIPVCKNKDNHITAYFGDDRWDCSPFCLAKGAGINHKSFGFSYLENYPLLRLQAKFIAYGWLYKQGHFLGRQSKLSAVATRFNGALKRAILILKSIGVESFETLSDGKIWEQFIDALEEKRYSRQTIELTFNALNAAARLHDWLPFNFEVPDLNIKALALKIAPGADQAPQQFLAIPQRIANEIYGEAIRLVEEAWPHKEVLAQLQRDLQQNYNEGRNFVDRKIQSGEWNFLVKQDGKLRMRLYTQEISAATPRYQRDIIAEALESTGLLHRAGTSRNWFSIWQGHLRAACFICCGAFTGMRISEIFEIHRNSFFTRTLDGVDFSVLSGSTHKLTSSKRNEEWLASPIVSKAVDLASALSASARVDLLELASQTTDRSAADALKKDSEFLWLSQKRRSYRPTISPKTSWRVYLQNFVRDIPGAHIEHSDISECLRINPFRHDSIATLKPGEPWPLSSHQFRRTFAVFAVQNNISSPVAIKQQFKHLNLHISQWYANGAHEAKFHDIMMDKELSKLIDQSKDEVVTSKFNDFFNTQEKLSGGFGKTIIAMRNDTPAIYSSWENLYLLVKEKRLTLHGTMHSYCKNAYNCDMDGVVNPAFCTDCSHSIIDTKNAEKWQEKHSRLTNYLSELSSISDSEHSHYITQIRAAERVMDDFEIPYQRFEYPIKVREL